MATVEIQKQRTKIIEKREVEQYPVTAEINYAHLQRGEGMKHHLYRVFGNYRLQFIAKWEESDFSTEKVEERVAQACQSDPTSITLYKFTVISSKELTPEQRLRIQIPR